MPIKPAAIILSLGFSIVFCGAQRQLNADIVLSNIGETVTETFQSYEGLGFSPGADPATGLLDSNTYRATGFSEGDGSFGGTHIGGDFGRGGPVGGGVTDGGAYAFDVGGGDVAVGVQPTDDDFTSGSFTIRIANNTGQTITGVRIGGLAHFFNDTNSATRWVFEGSLNDSEYLPFFFRDSPLDADETPAWSSISIGDSFQFPLADQGRFYLRITGDDLSVDGNRDEFALSTISFTAIPEPASLGILTLIFSGGLMRRKRICLN